jgi:hypothetical protein
MGAPKPQRPEWLDDVLLNQDQNLSDALGQLPTDFDELVTDQELEHWDSIIVAKGDMNGVIGGDDE